jgi:hypothetical protein
VNPSVERASRLRLAGRWGEALAEFQGRDDPQILVERVLILADESMLARDGSTELDEAIAAVERLAADDRLLEAFALARRGLALHGGFLHDRSRGRASLVHTLRGPLADWLVGRIEAGASTGSRAPGRSP